MATLDLNPIINVIASRSATLGYFERVNAHEPLNSPGTGLTATCWMNTIVPDEQASGLAATTLKLTVLFRIYAGATAEPADMIDPNMTLACTAVMSAISAGFTLDGTVRNVDLLGEDGGGMTAQAGWLDYGDRATRVYTITMPIVINDVLDQAA